MEVQYTEGGTPVILVPDSVLQGSGLCRTGKATTSNSSNGCKWRVNVPLAVTFLGMSLLSYIL